MTAPVIVAGAGIAGLSTAIALARRDIPVVVLERAPVLAEVGAGLQLSPNAVHALAALGLADAVATESVRPSLIRSVNAATGRTIAEIPLDGAPARYGAPYLVLPRPRLLEVLAMAAAADPRVELRLGCALESVRETADAVVAETAGGAVSGIALIGADGVGSRVRRTVLDGGAARPTGRVAYRATADLAAAPPEAQAETFLWLAPRAHLVHYPIGGRINLVAVVEEAPEADAVVDWDAAATADRVRRHFGGFAEPAASLLAAATEWRRWPLLAARPPAWTRGRVGLVGDAAHAMLPFLAQGAAMAIEDAVVLAARLAAAPTIAAGLAATERERRPRVERVVAEAARSGRIYHLAGPLAAARDAAMRLAGGPRLIARLDWLYGWRPPA